MYEAHKLLRHHDCVVNLVNKKYCCTGKEQNEFKESLKNDLGKTS